MKVIIIGSKDSGTRNNPKALFSEIDNNDKKLVYIEDLVFLIDNNEQKIINGVDGVDISNSDLVIMLNWYTPKNNGIYRDIAFTIGLYLKDKGKKYWNSEAVYQRSTTKLSMMMLLALENITIPKTYFTLNKKFAFDNQLKYPIIAKYYAASRGNDNYLIRDNVDFKKILHNDEKAYLIQEYIPNNHDIRIICFDGVPSLVIKRSRVSLRTHLNNTSQGASATIEKLDSLPRSILTDTKKVCMVTERQMAGVDWIISNERNKRIVCLEVNAIPQLTSGSFIKEKMEAMNFALRSLQ